MIEVLPVLFHSLLYRSFIIVLGEFGFVRYCLMCICLSSRGVCLSKLQHPVDARTSFTEGLLVQMDLLSAAL